VTIISFYILDAKEKRFQTKKAMARWNFFNKTKANESAFDTKYHLSMS
jgi:hypothetical protein